MTTVLDSGVLACPRHHRPLTRVSATELRCEQGHSFPVVEGIPVLLLDDAPQTIGIAEASLRRARGERGAADARAPGLYLESLAVSEQERQQAVDLARNARAEDIDPVVAVLVGATNGIAYKHLVGALTEYPIPEIRLPSGSGRLLLDIGCSWGRWCVSAARKGYRVVGIDPSLAALMAARRLARHFDLDIEFVCADARYLPFATAAFDTVFSYSVIQHFAKPEAGRAFAEIGRVLKPGGSSMIQMPNRFGIRSFYQWARRGLTEGSDFDVRYWGLRALRDLAQGRIGPTEILAHCYFGLGLEPSDARFMRPALKQALALSEVLRRASERHSFLVRCADSVYVRSTRQ